MKIALKRERRTNRRLRVIIESLREEIRETRNRVDVSMTRIGQIQAELDRLKPSKS